MTMGEKIKQLRKAKKMTQQKLGEKIDVHSNEIMRWEKGRNEPSIFNCICMADVFGVTLDELCCREVRANGQND